MTAPAAPPEPRTAEEMVRAILAFDPRRDVRAEYLVLLPDVTLGRQTWMDRRTPSTVYLGALIVQDRPDGRVD